MFLVGMVGCEPQPAPVVPSVHTPAEKTATTAAPGPSHAPKATGPIEARLDARQLARYQALAADSKAAPEKRARALRQLALWQADEGVELALPALADPHLRTRAARVLAHYAAGRLPAHWSPQLIAKVSGALDTALRAAPPEAHADLAVALVEWRARAGVSACLELLRNGKLAAAKRLEGGAAYDALKLGALVSRAELHRLSTDPSAAVRSFAAIALSHRATQADSAVLLKLLADPEIVVASETASGLVRIGSATTRGALLKRLATTKGTDRSAFLLALRAGTGARGLVLALSAPLPSNEAREWFQTRQLFEMLRYLRDPRAGTPLASWIQSSNHHLHWQTVAAQRLAEIGDLRAATYLGQRMLVEPATLYDLAKFWQADARGRGHLRRTDRPRIRSARLLADLAVLHPDAHGRLRNAAEGQVLKWLNARPSPHTNGLRFLGAVRSSKALVQMRSWAFPTDPLPAAGAQPPFPMAFETSQPALRYLGLMRDQQSRAALLQQLTRNQNPKLDITHNGLETGGLAMRGMALRAVAYGAANGLSEWGPQPKQPVTSKLRSFVEDKLQHEDAREAACQALAWLASHSQAEKILRRLDTLARHTDASDLFIAGCYAQTLGHRSRPRLAAQLVKSLLAAPPPPIRSALALAIGRAGVETSPPAQAQLLAAVQNGPLRESAALALMLGGSAKAAASAVASLQRHEVSLLRALEDDYYRALGYWSTNDLTGGRLYRWVRNARRLAHADTPTPQRWASSRLATQLDNLLYDNGPHSLTRNVLVVRLHRAARSGSLATRRAAITTLHLMKERGTLMALGKGKDDTARQARRALFELLHPAP